MIQNFDYKDLKWGYWIKGFLCGFFAFLIPFLYSALMKFLGF